MVKKNFWALDEGGPRSKNQQEMILNSVSKTKDHTGWPVAHILSGLGVSRASYHRYLRHAGVDPPEPSGPRHPYTLLAEEERGCKKGP